MAVPSRLRPPRPVWAPVPFLVRARAGCAWAAVSGVLGLAVIMLGVRVGEDPPNAIVLALLALVLLTIGVAGVALFLVGTAAGRGPGDAMSVYGAGRRVAVTWASRGHERGRIEVEDVGEGEVVALRRDGGAPHVTVRLGGHDLLLQGGPGPAEPEWFTLVDDAGYTLARADAARLPGADAASAPVDWTVRPARGPALRLRHRPAAALVSQVTLLDETGTPWWVRDGRLAELPDELDPSSAVFAVLLVDQLRRGTVVAHEQA